MNSNNSNNRLILPAIKKASPLIYQFFKEGDKSIKSPPTPADECDDYHYINSIHSIDTQDFTNKTGDDSVKHPSANRDISHLVMPPLRK